MVYETHEQMYQFTHLPRYAAFLLDTHLDDYTREVIRLSFAVDVPLLKYLAHLGPEELFASSRASNTEYLTALGAGKAKELIAASIERWLANQLPLVGKFDVRARDITLISHVRSKALKKWAPAYASELNVILDLYGEIDDFFLGFNTSATDTYIDILKAQLEEEAHFSSNLITASPGIIFIYDLVQGKEVYINGRVEEVMGYTTEEVLRMPDLIARHTHPDDLAVVTNFIERVCSQEQGRTQQAEYRFRSRQGSYQWLRTYAVVYKRDEEGRPVQLLGAAYEITSEKETATALAQREQQLLEAQAIGQIGSFEWDVVHDTSVSTPELRKIFEAEKRQTFEEMMQKVHPDDQPLLAGAMAEAFATGRLACEYRYLAPSGEKVIDCKGVVSYDNDGNPASMVGTIQDVTLRKRTEEGLLQKTLELERSNVQLQEFAYIASHDLKEPLRKISMFSDIIMSSDWEQLPDRARANVQKISDAAARMQQLIEGILAYSSLSRPLQKERCSLEGLLQEALNNLEYRIRDTGAVITSDGLPDAEVVPFQVQQVFQNLVGNALKFARKDEVPRIGITHTLLPPEAVKDKRLPEVASYLRIDVHDNGIGFSPEAEEKIFGLFQRLHARNEYEGSGLGLAICRKIVENHGGVITASSQVGEGATFTILLPDDKRAGAAG